MNNAAAASDRIQIRNKIHTAVTAGTLWGSRDETGRWAKASCGQASGKTRPHYVPADEPVTCQKCSA